MDLIKRRVSRNAQRVYGGEVKAVGRLRKTFGGIKHKYATFAELRAVEHKLREI